MTEDKDERKDTGFQRSNYVQEILILGGNMDIERPDFELVSSELDILAGSGESFEKNVDSCFGKVMTTMAAGRGFLLLCKGNESEWKPLVGRGLNLDTLFETEAVSKSIIRVVVERNIPIITTNAMGDPRFQNKQSVVVSEIRSVLCAPLTSGQELFGIIYLDNRFSDDFFDGDDRDYLVKCAEKLSSIIMKLPGNPVQP
jgi:GAF domain-containing protein